MEVTAIVKNGISFPLRFPNRLTDLIAIHAEVGALVRVFPVE